MVTEDLAELFRNERIQWRPVHIIHENKDIEIENLLNCFQLTFDSFVEFLPVLPPLLCIRLPFTLLGSFVHVFFVLVDYLRETG
jgi:hypothetical protein